MMKLVKVDHYSCLDCEAEFYITLDSDVDRCPACLGEVTHSEETEIVTGS